MENIKIIQIINLILAFSAVPPALFLLKKIMIERGTIEVRYRRINSILAILFIGVALGSIVNAGISVLSVVGYGRIAHNFSPYARSFVNFFFTFVSWNLGLFYKYIHKNKV
jgi:hypothetical protein